MAGDLEGGYLGDLRTDGGSRGDSQSQTPY